MATRAKPRPEHLFYDGGCGVCQWSVNFVVRHDRERAAFRFAPLRGETFQKLVSAEAARELPDTMVVRRHDSTLLIRSRAAIYVLRQLGGLWRVLSALLWLVPAPLRDWGYDLFARNRYRFAKWFKQHCPLLPPELRERFEP